MRRRRGRLSRDTWWLLLILGLSVGPLIASAFLAVGVAALASAAGLVPGVGPNAPVPAPGSPPAPPAPPPGVEIQFRITVEGDGEVYVSPREVAALPGRPVWLTTTRETR